MYAVLLLPVLYLYCQFVLYLSRFVCIILSKNIDLEIQESCIL